MNRLLIALFTAALLSGCMTTREIIYRDSTPGVQQTQAVPAPQTQVQTAPVVIQQFPAACPFGTYAAYWNGQPVCVAYSSPTVVYTYNSFPGPGFGWGLATGLVGAAIIHRSFGGPHYRHW